jgi:fimbrial isopeptide formation D2 family protein
MKKIHRVFAMLMAAIMALSLVTTAFAEPTIDPAKKASLSIYKYDITKASEDGVWDAESYVSTSLHDDAVVDKLSKYAIQGVEFTYLKVADVTMNNEVVDGQRQVGVLYGFDNSERSNAVLSAIGLTDADAHKTEGGVNYYTSDTLNNKLAAALASNATTLKNALEVAVKNGGVAMTETDATGHTSASNMDQGLYLVVETRVPEMVTSTCNPFFVSLPMTTIDGAAWNYDVTVYPKNQTGNPDLSKTVREAKNSTGKHNGSLTDITDGFEHTATASVGDVVDYQILSTLPTITSKASSLSEYTYVDTMSRGIRYNKQDVVIEFFKDAGCTDKITTWGEDSGKFTVVYDDTQNSMTIKMTEAGLSEINESEGVYVDSVKRGYSDCAMRITYAATLTADAQMGDKDNPNTVTLTWKRTNTTYFDTLEDCCHVYTYGVDILKQFSDSKGNIQNVKFLLHNGV